MDKIISREANGLWYKPCAVCGKHITHRYKSQLKQRTCSHNCQLKGNTFRKGKMPTNAFISNDTLGNKNVNWKGDKVGYDAVHDWIKRHYGQPQTCEHCDAINLGARKHQWANISGLYKRDINDWLRLCGKCHFKYDGRNRYIIAYHKSRKSN